MVLIGIGGNLAAPGFASPLATLTAAVAELPRFDVHIVKLSHWYETEPVPRSDQPWYVNAVAVVETGLSASELLAALIRLEASFERRRTVPNAARTLDLDLLDYRGQRHETPRLILPHPRLAQRRFVLAPLAEIAPNWRHPLS